MKKLIVLTVCILFNYAMDAQGVFRINGTNNAVQLGFDDYRFLTFGDGFTSPNNGAWSIERWNGGLNFWKPWPSSNFGNYKMFIRDNGNVGINMNPWTWSILKLQVSGYVVSNGYFTWSDEKLKTDIAQMEEGLAQLMLLKPVTYNYDQSINLGAAGPTNEEDETKRATMEGDNGGSDPDPLRHYGFLAHEVAEIFPNIVSPSISGENEINAVNYVELIPVLVNAMQQQQRTLIKQQQEIAAQKSRIEELSAIVKKN